MSDASSRLLSQETSPAPRVSVVVATRNRPELLRRALASVRAQTLTSYEIVVVDDGSDVEVREVHDGIRDEHADTIRWVQASPPGAARGGPGAPRNRGIEHARGTFIAFLDDDDVWTDANHLLVATEALDVSGADFFFANQEGVRGEQVLMDNLPAEPHLVQGERLAMTEPVFKVSLKNFVRTARAHVVHPNFVVARRETVRSTGGFLEKVRYAEDYGFALCLADRANSIVHRPAKVARQRLPEGDSSSLTQPELGRLLDSVTVGQYVRANCASSEVVRCARATQSWFSRQVSVHLASIGRRSALGFAWEAVCVFPTLGNTLNLVQVALGVMRRKQSKVTAVDTRR